MDGRGSTDQLLALGQSVDGASKSATGAGDTTATNGAADGSPPDAATTTTKQDGTPEPAEAAAQPEPKVSYFKLLFRFADSRDCALMLVGFLASIVTGVTLPIMTIPFGNMVDVFADYADDQDRDQFNDGIAYNSLFFVALGAANFAAGFLQVFLFLLSGERMSRKLRNGYVRAIFRQDIGWHDGQKTGELVSRIASDTYAVQEGIGEKIGTFVQFITTFLGGFAIGFVRGWRIALVLLSIVPILAIGAALLSKFLASMSEEGSDAYAEAGSVAAEAISNIRTVAAFGGEKRAWERYGRALVNARKIGIKKGVYQGLMVGIVYGIMFCGYAIAFFYGGILVSNGTMTGGEVLSAFFAVIIGAFSLGNAGPPAQSFAAAAGAGYRIFEVLDRQSPIDALSDGGACPTEPLRGEVTLERVNFAYPMRPDVPILNSLSLTLEAGKRTALVGRSGSGKSTIIALTERFYDPQAGAVRLDGRDVRELNIHWLRRQCGLVSQEPVLFDLTIEENIMLGGDNVTHEQVVVAAQLAHIHDFIMQLPSKYDTRVGEKGAQLSGGQKQRIAIARALVRNPPIMLLDEATSALDTESEGIVQSALDTASRGRTTVVIAHRLSTIQTADCIVVMDGGAILERGTHASLMANPNSHYRALVEQQLLNHGRSSASGEGGEAAGEHAPAADDRRRASASKGIVGLHGALDTSGAAAAAAAKEGEGEDKAPKEVYHVPLARLAALSAPEWKWLAIGSFSSLVNGVVMPLFSIVFAEILGVFTSTDSAEIRRETRFWAGMFVVLGVVTFLCNLGLITCFAISGEWLTQRLRQMSFEKILRREVAFFDYPENNTGILTTRLAVDASLVQGLFGQRIGNLLSMIVTAVAGLIIALVASWELTLVVLATAPVIMMGGALEMQALTGHAAGAKKAYEAAGSVANEAISNMRTVQGLATEEHFLAQYSAAIKEPFQRGCRQGVVAGLGYGLSQGAILFVYALAFWYGAQLVVDEDITFTELMTSFMAIIFCSMVLGQMSSFAPEAGKARVAASHIFRLLDSCSQIDPMGEGGAKLDAPPQGGVQLASVRFDYPARPDVSVLQSLDLASEPGQTVAIVGASGSGKSTVIQLIERFYDPLSGSVQLDGRDIRELHLRTYRAQLGLVSQEPALFGMSIADNIAYGAASDDVPVTHDMIEGAARAANIHDFIASLPNGYDTQVGERGAQLSGGQKQRIAIARALLRNPRILLLDEATSALDSESERIVQDALDKARAGRTTFVVAHRLATVQHADKIVVIQHGKVVEVGTHDSLLERRGVYYQLASRQFAE